MKRKYGSSTQHVNFSNGSKGRNNDDRTKERLASDDARLEKVNSSTNAMFVSLIQSQAPVGSS